MDEQRQREDERLGIPHQQRKEIEERLTKCFLNNRNLYSNSGWFIGVPRTNASITAIFAQALPQYAGLDVEGLNDIYQKCLIAVKKEWEKEDMKEAAADNDIGPQLTEKIDNLEGLATAIDSADNIGPKDLVPQNPGETGSGIDAVVNAVNTRDRYLQGGMSSPELAKHESSVNPAKDGREDLVVGTAKKGDARTFDVALRPVSGATLDDLRRAPEKRKFDSLGDTGDDTQGADTSTKKQKPKINKKGIARPVKKGR